MMRHHELYRAVGANPSMKGIHLNAVAFRLTIKIAKGTCHLPPTERNTPIPAVLYAPTNIIFGCD